MNKINILICVIIGVGGLSTANAVPISYNFSQGGFEEGASVSGSFTGEDLNSDGHLSWTQGEISAFDMSFSGNSLVTPFSLGFNYLHDLEYNLYNATLGDESNEHYYAYRDYHGYNGWSGGPSNSIPSFPPGITARVVEVVPHNYFAYQDYTTQHVLVNPSSVPEPPLIWLFGPGLLALIGVARRRKTWGQAR